MRNNEVVDPNHKRHTAVDADMDLDYLDVPAFLRRQAD